SGSGVKTPPEEPVTATVATPPQDETNKVASVHTPPPADTEASGSGVERPPEEPVTATVATPPQDPSNEVEMTGEDSQSPTTQQTHSSAPGAAVPHPAGETILARDLQRQHSARFGDPFANASLPTRPAPARLREDRNTLHLQNMLNQQASERLSASDRTDSGVTKPPRAKLRD
ncbi:hypothetical protein, partial [Erwinia typographi]|uniref:hypothetical protein n=1 Tax=Erwinia typographi TaxID=371042 RepID=UPI001E4D6980